MHPSQSVDNSPKSKGNIDESSLAPGTLDPPRPEELPRTFGRWTLLRQIARGGMGEVYLAATGGIEGTERPCVVKIIRRDHAADQSFAARFLDEARIQTQLGHPGVAQVFEASTDPTGVAYIAMEYVEGRNLAELRHRATRLDIRISWADAVAIGIALGEALAYVHERTDVGGKPLEIAHRDLSPQNVMVSFDGEVKIIDFGTARGHNRRSHTVAGIVFAKPGYVAPEVANQQPGGAPADLYALGVMLWELVSGQRFLTGTPAEHLSAIAAGQRKLASLGRMVDAPAKLDAVLGRLTAYRIEDRTPSARHAITELVDLLQHAPALPDGQRSVRSRIARAVARLFPSEPARCRIDFARLLGEAKEHLHAVCPVALPPATAAVESGVVAATEGADLLAGTRYRLLRELGRGGMGVVYEAEHIDLGRVVALKVLHPERAQCPALEQRFRKEARAIAALSHDHLVRLYDFGLTADGRPYAAMERLEGETLDRTLEREKRLSWPMATRLSAEVCRALEVAHQAGLVHRDIKPGNVFITREGKTKLLDFGIAKVSSGAPDESSQGLVLGTPEYMAPEQAVGACADPRADLYALGVVLYELITGVLPQFGASTLPTSGPALAELVSPAESVSSLRFSRGVPKMLASAIERATMRDPEKRFQDATEMRMALEAALREPERRRSRRRRTAGALLGMLGLALLGGGAALRASPALARHAETATRPALEALMTLGRETSSLRARWAKTAVPDAASVLGSATAPPPRAIAPRAPDESITARTGTAPSEDEENGETDEIAASDEPNPSSRDNAENAAETVGDAEREDLARQESSEPAAKDPTAAPTPVAPDVELQVASASELVQKGQPLKGYHQLRNLGRRHAQDPRVLKAWCAAAVATGRWGDAYSIAQRWVAADPSTESHLELARMQRAVGQRSQAMRTVAAVLKDDPDSEQAKRLQESLKEGLRKVARN